VAAGADAPEPCSKAISAMGGRLRQSGMNPRATGPTLIQDKKQKLVLQGAKNKCRSLFDSARMASLAQGRLSDSLC
jgi:hypothetical protein